jgi:hypothetical protein
MRKILLSTIVFCTWYAALFAQSTQVLQNLPPSVKWYQLKTPHFKIIYPAGFTEQGQRMANTMEHIYGPASASLEVDPRKKFPLILQNHNSTANGFVTLGPRRSEFFTMSPQKANLLGNNDWLNMLALHEYRHVVQYDKSRTGFTGFVRNLFGEFSQAAIANSTVPSWFWEGDAVGVETALSTSGRGRFPQFSAAFRANLLTRGAFNYNKQYLKSFKDFIPNHYVLGYHYSTYLKNEYGSEAVAQMVNRTWALPFIPFSFSFAQKKYGGEKMPQMYQQMMTQLEEKWRAQQTQIQLTDFALIETKPKKVYTDYNYPQLLDNGNILVLKSGLGDYDQLVEIDKASGDEFVRFVTGTMNDAGILSVQGSTVVWNEIEFDPRWRQLTYSVIRSYNIGTGNYTELTEKTRYTSAALSPDRSRIATVEQLTDYSNQIVVIDAYAGSVLHIFKAPEGSAYITPIWSDNQHLVLSEIRDGAKQIKEIDVQTGDEEVLLAPTEEQITYAFRKGKYLYYVSGWTGIDNVYARDLDTNKTYQVTSAKFGASNPVLSSDGSTLYYNNFTALGNDVVKVANDPSSWRLIDNLPDTDIRFYEPMVALEGNADILNTIPQVAYTESRYRKKPIKLHSWGPFVGSSQNELEAGLYSTNVLSTTDVFVGFRVDRDANFKWIGRVSYQNLYPIIDVEANFAKRNASINYRDSTDAILTDRQTWDETGVKAGLRIPWLFTRNKFHTNLIVQNYFGLTNVQNYQSDTFGKNRLSFGKLNDGNLLNNEFRVILSSLQKRSKRDIESKFGSVFIIENFSTPYGGDFAGGLLALKTQLYFPGLAKHHSFNVFAGYQHNNITLFNNNYWFANRMPYPRGVAGTTLEDFFTVRTNYALPLLYPDLSIGPWLYIQRVKTNLFYDFGTGQTNVTNFDLNRELKFARSYYSLGAELTFDFNFMRALPLLELGVRYFYLPDLGQSGFEFLVGSFGF